MASSFDNPYSNTYNHAIPSNRNDHVGSHPLVSAHEELKAWDTAVSPHRARTGTTLLTPIPLKTLVFRKKIFSKHMSIWHKTDWHETPQYFASCSTCRPKTPDVTLNAVIVGQDALGPVLGVAHFRYSRHVRFGMGDPQNDPNSVTWEDMRNVSKMLGKGKYEWEFVEIPEWNDIMNDNHPPGPRRFRWQRTVNIADGVANKLSLRNYRLTDQDTGAVVAIFLASTLGEVRKRGELRLFEELRPKAEQAVVLTCASISEKLHRD